MGATRNRFVCGRDKRTEECSLTNSPTGKNGSGIFDNEADGKQEQWQGERQQRAKPDGGKHPRTKRRIAGGEEIAPVEAGRDEDESEKDGNDMPDDPPALEAANEVAGRRHQKLFHAEMAGRAGKSVFIRDQMNLHRLLPAAIRARAVQIN